MFHSLLILCQLLVQAPPDGECGPPMVTWYGIATEFPSLRQCGLLLAKALWRECWVPKLRRLALIQSPCQAKQNALKNNNVT